MSTKHDRMSHEVDNLSGETNKRSPQIYEMSAEPDKVSHEMDNLSDETNK